MGLNQVLYHLKPKLIDGEHNIHTINGLPKVQDRELFKQATEEQRKAFIVQWKESGKIKYMKKVSVQWKEVLLKYKNFQKLF